ncbi:MAG: hypothetical protein GY727_01075 [Gammaproteobacteria bacterium]|nr:hypothetical protein [Gammaproteobacteria bacterium]MCP4089784.1 hypothetical protein [Gammaproteobacteria bacterium]MCP4278199.1 hypothetical protein [Gammaproteobacteria bacterium]MCP4831918.1 hypothetical protein [Gammaproteobacteria bacterium]MCP4927610.1 hypothetical protein [Gammaproteobacteria bacterium]
MQVRDINLLHHLKQGSTESVCLDTPHLSHLNTCQKQLWITDPQLALLPTIRNFVHLGTSQKDLSALSLTNSLNTIGLDDIFALQAAQNELHMTQVTRAQQARKERATLRNLGASVTLPDGWEDLAAFG